MIITITPQVTISLDEKSPEVVNITVEKINVNLDDIVVSGLKSDNRKVMVDVVNQAIADRRLEVR